MEGKKDPGKFTVRFNLCDPQQRQAAELLNQQGRSKAQFIANAVLHYASGQISIPHKLSAIDSEHLRRLVEDVLAQQKGQSHERASAESEAPASTGNDALNDEERSLIFKTLDVFQKQ